MQKDVIILNEARNVSLTVYLQEIGGEFRHVAKRPAVLILPGGGYQMCSDREADPVAMPYLAAGYQAFILRYSVAENAQWPNPLEDYEQAMSVIRSRAEEWNLYADKIAVIGFSAGGHLAAAAATMSKNRPNAAILGYAVVSNDVKGCNLSAPDTVSAVDKNTCPCFLFSARTDKIVHIVNSIDFIKALTEHDIAFESHIYAYGPHGFSTGDTSVQNPDTTEICARVPNWVQDSIGWLRDMFGEFGSEGIKPPMCKAYVSANHEPFLSINCTIGYLARNPAAKAILDNFLAKAKNDDLRHQWSDGVNDVTRKMTLSGALSFMQVGKEVLSMLDGQLRKIPNA